jgi:hypothetical protein
MSATISEAITHLDLAWMRDLFPHLPENEVERFARELRWLDGYHARRLVAGGEDD